MSDRIIFLIGFNYDKATRITFTWITDKSFLSFFSSRLVDKYHVGDSAEQTELGDKLNLPKPKDIKTVEIFCGHGSKLSLLGPPQTDKQKHSHFYHWKMIADLPSSLFAFCCHAGRSFGTAYVTAGRDRTFMGFSHKVYLLPEINSYLKEIFHKISINIVEVGEITKNHEEEFRRLINNLMTKIKNGEIECEDPELLLYHLRGYKMRLVRI